MTTRNVKKSLAGMEDLVQGIGTVSQTRAGEAVEVTRVDVPLYVEDETAMSALDVSKWTRARIYDTTVSFTDYIYDADSLEGIESDTGPGTWLVSNPGATGTFATADAKTVTVVNGVITSIE